VRLQQDVVLQQAVPDRRLEKAQGRVQKSTQTQEARLQQDKFLVGVLLSVAMRGGGHKGVFGTILSYV